MSPFMALRVISRGRSSQVAFGEKRTLSGRRGPLAKSRMTWSGLSTTAAGDPDNVMRGEDKEDRAAAW